MSTQAVFFDIDGTLVDSNGYHVEAWYRVFQATGRPIDRHRIAEQIGKGTDNLVPTLFPNLPDAEVERLGTLHGQFFKADYLDRVRPLPGAAELVRRVHDSGRQAVLASSAGAGERDHYLDLLGIHDAVSTSTTSDDVGTTKPAPDIFAVAAKKAGVEAANVVVVGDAPYDMEAAAKCGMTRIAVRSGGFDDETLTQAGAQMIVDDVAELLARFDATPLAG